MDKKYKQCMHVSECMNESAHEQKEAAERVRGFRGRGGERLRREPEACTG